MKAFIAFLGLIGASAALQMKTENVSSNIHK